MPGQRPTAYRDHIETLTALITYLALCPWRSRSPHGLSRDLGLDEDRVTLALVGFPGLFRKSRNLVPTDVGDQNCFTLHARYATRRQLLAATDRHPSGSLSDPQPEQDGRGEELDVDILRSLLDFVTSQARVEEEGHRFRLNQRLVLTGVMITAVSSLTAVLQLASR
jgi:hypothetical protein